MVDRIEHGAFGASVLSSRSAAYLSWDKRTETTQVSVAGPTQKGPPWLVVRRRESGISYYTTVLLWDTVAYKQVRAGADGIRLVVRSLSESGVLGAPQDIGRIGEVAQIESGEDEPHMSGCRSEDTTVIRAKGWQNTYVSFYANGRWTPPVESEGVWGRLTCASNQAIVTRVLGGPAAGSGRFKGGVLQSVCTASGCRSVNVDFGALTKDAEQLLPKDAEDLKAVPVGDKLLVVWRAGARGGVRFRLARAEELASQKDTVVYDDLAESAESTVVGLDLLPGKNGAVLLLGTTQGVYSLFIGDGGAVAPMTMRVL